MRIVPQMINNTSNMHIQRNMRALDEAMRQVQTRSLMSRPSDDPVRASRALIFRTGVAENAQFQSNVRSALSQMGVSEASLIQLNDEVIREIRDLLVQGLSDTYELSDKLGIVRSIQSFFATITTTLINQQYAGQFVFSGLRTDEPPVFNQANTRSFVITQHFSLTDITREYSFQRLPDPERGGLLGPVVHNISVLKLAYSAITTQPPFAPNPPGQDWPDHIDNPDGINIPGFHVRKVCQSDPRAYLPDETYPGPPPLPMIHLVAQTGELVMHTNTANQFPREGVSVTFRKDGFDVGDLNPTVYFTAREIIDGANLVRPPFSPADVDLVYRITQYFSRADGTPNATPPTAFEFNLAHPVYADENGPLALRPQFPAGSIIDVTAGTVTIPAHHFERGRNISVSYTTQNPTNTATTPPTHIKTDLSVAGVELVRATHAPGSTLGVPGLPIPLDQVEVNRSFDMHNQDRVMEFAHNTFIPTNALAKNILTDSMMGDFRRLFQFANSLQITETHVLRTHFEEYYEGPPNYFTGDELEEAVNNAISEQLYHENTNASGALHRMLDNMLRRLDGHAATAAREHTVLGSGMLRLTLLQNRLEEDAVTYRRLVSENEDTPMDEGASRLASAEVALFASIQASSGILNMSLANFLR